MKWIIVGLAVTSVLLLGTGYFASRSDNIDTRQSSVVPAVIGAGLLALDLALLVVFVIYKAFTT